MGKEEYVSKELLESVSFFLVFFIISIVVLLVLINVNPIANLIKENIIFGYTFYVSIIVYLPAFLTYIATRYNDILKALAFITPLILIFAISIIVTPIILDNLCVHLKDIGITDKEIRDMICELIGLAMQGGFAMIYVIGFKIVLRHKNKVI